MSQLSPGQRFRQALAEEQPLQVIGAINANHALLAKRAGFRAIYLSGGGVAAGSLGLPDLGINTLDDVLTDVRRITDVCDLPLLVDVDTGFGSSAFNVARTVKSMIKFGAAAIHIEDQVGAKRCGHRPGKEIVSVDEMADRVKAAADAKTVVRMMHQGDPGWVALQNVESWEGSRKDAKYQPVKDSRNGKVVLTDEGRALVARARGERAAAVEQAAVAVCQVREHRSTSDFVQGWITRRRDGSGQR